MLLSNLDSHMQQTEAKECKEIMSTMSEECIHSQSNQFNFIGCTTDTVNFKVLYHNKHKEIKQSISNLTLHGSFALLLREDRMPLEVTSGFSSIFFLMNLYAINQS